MEATTPLLEMARGFLRWNEDAGATVLPVHHRKLWCGFLLGAWFLKGVTIKWRSLMYG